MIKLLRLEDDQIVRDGKLFGVMKINTLSRRLLQFSDKVTIDSNILFMTTNK